MSGLCFYRIPQLLCGLEQERQQADQGRGSAVVQVGDGGGPDQGGGRQGTGV